MASLLKVQNVFEHVGVQFQLLLGNIYGIRYIIVQVLLHVKVAASNVSVMYRPSIQVAMKLGLWELLDVTKLSSDCNWVITIYGIRCIIVKVLLYAVQAIY